MDITVIALALVLFLVVFAIIQYNKLIRLNIQVDEGFADWSSIKAKGRFNS